MEPKFQSSFIPKEPFATTSVGPTTKRKSEGGGFLGFLALVIFIISVVLALGVFGYKYYLKYRIQEMGASLEQAQTTLEPETINELTRLDGRINSTKELIAKHRVLTPLFEFLEKSTPKTTRLNFFQFSITESGLLLSLKGEARGYAALALLADGFDKSKYFRNGTFSNLNLNEKGDVSFTFEGIIDPNLLSYSRSLEQPEI